MPDEDSSVVEVIITGPDESWLIGFTGRLIADRLAACGQHSTVRSVYTWDGKIEDDRETRVALHTRAGCVPAIVERTRRDHPYDVPCVIAMPIIDGNPDYQAWILDNTAVPDPTR